IAPRARHAWGRSRRGLHGRLSLTPIFPLRRPCMSVHPVSRVCCCLLVLLSWVAGTDTALAAHPGQAKLVQEVAHDTGQSPAALNALLDGATAFYQQHRALLDRIATEYGVAPQYVVAIIGVETNYGRIVGRYKVLDAL